MSGPDERSTGDRPADDDAAEQLLAASAELGDTEHETGWRSRSGTVRRRQRVVRGATASETEIRERVKVRTVTEEGVGGQPPAGPGPAAATEPAEPAAPMMLDAQGNPIVTPSPATTATAAPTPAPVSLPDPGRFLADAVHSYLDGLDDLGADHPVTADRLAQLRRTLQRYERG